MRSAARLLLWCFLLAWPAPALGDGVLPNYVTTVTAIRSAPAGLTATLPKSGESITVSNSGTTPVTIYGYEGEPYVRIGPDGVWENTRSPAVYLDQEQTIDSLPTDVNAKAAPAWKRISVAHRFQWHDHRIHWMGAAQAPSAQRDPHHQHLINDWKIPFSEGTATAPTGDIDGTLEYVPSSHAGSILTWGIIAAALILVVVLQLFFGRRRTPPERQLHRVA